MTAPDDLSATLAGIKDRGYRNGATGAECARLSDAAAEDVPRLVAALETALAHHVEAVIFGTPEPFRYCKTCSGHPAWPCPEVADITAALAGENPDA
jgi:hypothetical protein